MACGSGSFLLGAYQFLLDYYLKWYLEHKPQKHSKAVTKIGDAWRLTTAERKRILLTHIYGVDIDRQAVEVTKLSLLLKVLEGENEQSLQMELFARERALPNLDRNIKCGNSLIGPDYFGNQLLPDPEEYRRVNPFDWQSEFPDAMKAGGFDCVIGNPPYVFGGNYGIEQFDKEYFKNSYFSSGGKINLFTLFLERANQLVANHGLTSYIIPNTFLRVTSYSGSREYVLKETAVRQIVDLGVGVFQGATTSSIILVLERYKNASDNKVKIQIGINGKPVAVAQSEFMREGYVFNVRTSPQESLLTAKLNRQSIQLGTLCKELIFGVVITKNRDEIVSERPKSGYKPFLEGRDISRYTIRPTAKYLHYEPKLLHRPRTPAVFEAREKLLIQRITGGMHPLKVAYYSGPIKLDTETGRLKVYNYGHAQTIYHRLQDPSGAGAPQRGENRQPTRHQTWRTSDPTAGLEEASLRRTAEPV
jgi:hypothetical protein